MTGPRDQGPPPAERPPGATIEDARAVAATLPRSVEAVVHGSLRFRVGRIVYASFTDDDTIMGFAFPKDERDALVAAAPDTFLLPRTSDLRFNWVCVRLAAIDREELWELLVDAWRMCVPKKVVRDAGLDDDGWGLRSGNGGTHPT